MNKVVFENKVLLELYTKNLFGQDIESAANIVAGDFDITVKKAKDVLFDLKNKSAIIIKDDVVFENKKKSYELEKHNLLNSDKQAEKEENNYQQKHIEVGDMVLCTIMKDSKGYMYAKAHNGVFDNCMVYHNDLARSGVGKTCLLKITDTKNGYTGSVEQVFGLVDDPIAENIAIAAKYGFTNKFPNAVVGEARQISPYVTDEQKKGRSDLRNLNFLTIDPEGCKDKDDAIYDEILPDGSIRTYIAIADVSSGVKPGSELDKEAFKRGNSCYLGGGVYPMLPTELSNGIFSLDENKERLAVVASAVIKPGDKKKIYDPKIELAVIKVKKSYSYPEAEKTHLAEEGFDEINASTKQQLDLLYQNTPIIEKRYNSMLVPDSHEPEYKFGENGSVVEDIGVSNEEYSHKVVEARMLLANEIVAKVFMDYELVGLFRTHKPSMESKITKLQETLIRNGVDFKLENTTQSYKKLIEEVKNSPARDYLMFEIIKSLSKAEYAATADETGHFGLGISGDRGYMHFTSPIRRYSDLITHRLLKKILTMGKTNIGDEVLEQIAEHLNTQERKADKAEIESDQYLACLWAEKHKNELHQGIITKIQRDTVEVLHSNCVTRVLIPFSSLKGATQKPYVASHDCLSISNNKYAYKIGDRIDFKFDIISLPTRTIFATNDYEKDRVETESQTMQKVK